MPVFGTPFAGNSLDKKLSEEEMVRAVRFAIAAEMEATQLYMQIAESSTDPLVQKVMKSVADEERVHVGEFLQVLFRLDSTEINFYERGFEEVKAIVKSSKEEG